MRAEDYTERNETIDGWRHIVTYRIGDMCCCTIDNSTPAPLARQGATRRRRAYSAGNEEVSGPDAQIPPAHVKGLGCSPALPASAANAATARQACRAEAAKRRRRAQPFRAAWQWRAPGRAR
jgi:hypothetical protein